MSHEEEGLIEYLRKRRAERRMFRRRAVTRALRLARLFGIPPPDAIRWARHNADNPKSCSCWMCGHTRKWQGTPVSEVRRERRDEDQP
jgi:hypothetical protein